MIKLPIEIGDILLVGRFKNKRIKVKEIGIDEHGLPTVNGRGILKIRIEKLMEPKKNLKENKPGTRSSYRQEIDWIMYEVDFVPDDIETYKKWPEPWKTKALKALKYRKQHFDQMSKDKLKTYESKQFSLAQTVKKILKENEYKSKLDKQFKNEHGDLSIIKRNAIKSDNSGPYATTATSIDEYDVVSLSEKKYDKNYILNWAREIWKSSSMVDRKVDKVMAFKDMWTVTVTTTVWQN